MTLVDSRPGIRASMAALTQETGVPIDIEVVINRLGPKLEWELAHWFPAERVAHACKRYRARYWEHCVGDGTVLLPSARAAVDAVRARRGRITLLLGAFSRVLPESTAIVELRIDSTGGSFTALSPHAADILPQLAGIDGATSARIAGTITRENVAGAQLERATFRFERPRPSTHDSPSPRARLAVSK